MNIVPDCLICGENVDMEKDELGNWICTTCQQYTHWTRSEQGGYFSYHILVTYLGNKEPKYHVLKNPDGDGWVIGVFYSFIGGEYVRSSLRVSSCCAARSKVTSRMITNV